ncbi:HAAS signaling domain-containing protein [Pseudonocardia lacus]|uniref:HAAS signaling domain-containing protein n=1 Tax=Pseudonocardia lacus TaxID=2835865 RepID=UPI001BDC2FD2|nr:hypothetical protein [Pseudonocardia lacus]
MNAEDDGKKAPPAGAGDRPAVQVLDGAAREFLDGVRAALSDLPPGEVDEILDDVRAHLTELTGELGASPDREALAARSGTPQAYAAELRAAAGYPPPPVARPVEPQGRTTARLAVLGMAASTLMIPFGLLFGSEALVLLGVLGVPLALPALLREGPRMTAVAELPELRAPLARLRRLRTGFVGDLQAGWWVVRAIAAAVVLTFVFVDRGPLAVVLLAVIGIPISVWLGRLSRTDRRLLWLVVPLNALAVAVVVLVPTSWSDSPSPAASEADYAQPGLYQDGEYVYDIRPVDANGVPLTGVYLFDQDGRPIDVDQYSCREADESYYDAPEAVRPYPRGTYEVDPDTGRCVLVPPAPLVVAVPTATATAAPAPGAVTPAAPAPVTPTG